MRGRWYADAHFRSVLIFKCVKNGSLSDDVLSVTFKDDGAFVHGEEKRDAETHKEIDDLLVRMAITVVLPHRSNGDLGSDCA